MSEEMRDAPANAGGEEVKVVDRRRFRPDGLPVEGGGASELSAEGEGPGAAAGAPEEAKDEDGRLAALKARIDELSRAYASLVEDNRAFRQRLEREKERVVEAERAGVAQALLEAADDLERALSAVNSAEVRDLGMKNLLKGVRLSLSALHKRIGELGAERIPVAGQPFDPRLAEAVDTVPIADASLDGFVVQEIRPGYRIGDRVLRPARVRVGRLARA
ncbi:MAG TPA: nucleotide exchange factor GrpE [Anaeromyxobacter sp.]|nr:nucleotide exchange factor GrpE [Anaeromyxobacter sp.]